MDDYHCNIKLEGKARRKDDLTSAHIHLAERLDPIQNHWVPLEELSSPKMSAKYQNISASNVSIDITA